MSTFDTMIANAALAQIKGLGAEQVTYTPRNVTPRTIWALIERNPPEPVGMATNSGSVDVYVVAANDTDGVISPRTGADTITFKARQSDATAKTYTVGSIVSQDAGIWHFRIRTQG